MSRKPALKEYGWNAGVFRSERKHVDVFGWKKQGKKKKSQREALDTGADAATIPVTTEWRTTSGGFLSAEELADKNLGCLQRIHDELHARRETAMSLFRSLDRDNNQQIDRDEFVSGMRRLGIEKSISDADIKRAFNTLDEDENGVLSFRELEHFIHGRLGNREHLARAAARRESLTENPLLASRSGATGNAGARSAQAAPAPPRKISEADIDAMIEAVLSESPDAANSLFMGFTADDLRRSQITGEARPASSPLPNGAQLSADELDEADQLPVSATESSPPVELEAAPAPRTKPSSKARGAERSAATARTTAPHAGRALPRARPEQQMREIAESVQNSAPVVSQHEEEAPEDDDVREDSGAVAPSDDERMQEEADKLVAQLLDARAESDAHSAEDAEQRVAKKRAGRAKASSAPTAPAGRSGAGSSARPRAPRPYESGVPVVRLPRNRVHHTRSRPVYASADESDGSDGAGSDGEEVSSLPRRVLRRPQHREPAAGVRKVAPLPTSMRAAGTRAVPGQRTTSDTEGASVAKRPAARKRHSASDTEGVTAARASGTAKRTSATKRAPAATARASDKSSTHDGEDLEAAARRRAQASSRRALAAAERRAKEAEQRATEEHALALRLLKMNQELRQAAENSAVAAEAQRELEAARGQIRALEIALTDARGRMQSAEDDDSEALREELAQAATRIEELEDDLARAHNELQHARAKTDQQKDTASAEAWDAELARVRGELVEAQRANSELLRDLEDAQREADAATARADASAAAATSLHEADRDAARMRLEVASARDSIAALERQASDAAAERDAARDRCDELEQAVAAAEHKAEALALELAAANERLQEQSDAESEREKRITHMESSLRDKEMLLEELERSSEEVQTLQERVGSLEKRRDELEHDCAKLEKETSELQHSNAALEKENASLARDAKATRSHDGVPDSDTSGLREALDELRERNAALEKERDAALEAAAAALAGDGMGDDDAASTDAERAQLAEEIATVKDAVGRAERARDAAQHETEALREQLQEAQHDAAAAERLREEVARLRRVVEEERNAKQELLQEVPKQLNERDRRVQELEAQLAALREGAAASAEAVSAADAKRAPGRGQQPGTAVSGEDVDLHVSEEAAARDDYQPPVRQVADAFEDSARRAERAAKDLAGKRGRGSSISVVGKDHEGQDSTPKTKPPPPSTPPPEDSAKDAAGPAGSAAETAAEAAPGAVVRGSRFCFHGPLVMTIHAAHGLPKLNDQPHVSPYCTIKIGAKKFRTRRVQHTTRPEWNKDVTVELSLLAEGDETLVEIKVNDEETMDMLGCASLSIADLVASTRAGKAVPLREPVSDSDAGEIEIAFHDDNIEALEAPRGEESAGAASSPASSSSSGTGALEDDEDDPLSGAGDKDIETGDADDDDSPALNEQPVSAPSTATASANRFARGVVFFVRDETMTNMDRVFIQYIHEELLRPEGIEYRVIEVSRDQEAMRYVMEWSGDDELPKVFAGGHFVGDLQRIEALETDGGLVETLRQFCNDMAIVAVDAEPYDPPEVDLQDGVKIFVWESQLSNANRDFASWLQDFAFMAYGIDSEVVDIESMEDALDFCERARGEAIPSAIPMLFVFGEFVGTLDEIADLALSTELTQHIVRLLPVPPTPPPAPVLSISIPAARVSRRNGRDLLPVSAFAVITIGTLRVCTPVVEERSDPSWTERYMFDVGTDLCSEMLTVSLNQFKDDTDAIESLGCAEVPLSEVLHDDLKSRRIWLNLEGGPDSSVSVSLCVFARIVPPAEPLPQLEDGDEDEELPSDSRDEEGQSPEAEE